MYILMMERKMKKIFQRKTMKGREKTNQGKKTENSGKKEGSTNDDNNMNKNKKKESKDKSTGEMSSTSQTGQCYANDTTPKVSASGKSRKVKSVENKHSKHLCKKCHISFATSRILSSKHIKNFHDFSRVSSDDEEDDGEIQVIHDDNEALATDWTI